jgi:hypothetical protein
MVGYDVGAYMRFFIHPDAPGLIEKNVRPIYLFILEHLQAYAIPVRLILQSAVPRTT